MGRVSRWGPLLGVALVAVGVLAGCASPLQSFIFEMLFGPPYRREMAKLVPTPNTGSFGFGVDISGDYMIVGEPGGDGGKGRAWVYHRTTGETWDSGTLLPAPAGALPPGPTNNNYGDSYGYAVATDGAYAVLGGQYAGDGGTSRGRVAIYNRNTTSGVWEFLDTISLVDVPGATPMDYDRFGSSLSIDGTWLAVGARQDNDGEAGGPSYGAVYLFQNVGGTWTYKEKKRATTPQQDASFGFSVDISGDTMIVGSHYEDIDGDGLNPFRQGAAYLYRFDTDNWQFSDRITAPDSAHMALFGVSVGISGNYAIVGSPMKTVSAVTDAGAAYVFQRSGADDWHSIAPTILALGTPAAGDWFGWSSAISGDTAVVGAFNRDQAATNDGAVFVYTRTNGNTWELAGTVSPSDAASNQYFGIGLSLDGTRAAVGATAPPPATAAGAVYVLK
jgi:hypothetical protein